jgi:sec-independent protein translocase protein TatC
MMGRPIIADIDESKAPLMDHLVELRKRLIWSLLSIICAFFITFYFSSEIYDWLAHPLREALGPQAKLISTEVTGQFWVRVEVAIYAALMCVFPVIATQIWMFVAPGLYRHEKKAFLPFLFMTPVLFGAGVMLAYLMMPLALKALLIGPFALTDAGPGIDLAITPDVQKYLGFVRQLLFAFGLSFQLPVLMMLLVRAGIVELETLRKGRRYAIVIAFAVAAVLTPPDVTSQLMLAIPLCLLYEMTLLLLRFMARPGKAENPLPAAGAATLSHQGRGE